MSDVIRYDYLYNEDGELQLEELPIGRFVYHSDYAALRTRHNALRDAVAWERETYLFWEFGRTYTLVANDEALESMFAARAEVDRLIANQGSDDCQWEG